METRKDIIIINAIPNNPQKIKMLEEQLFYFKKLNMPIMVVSGCGLPEHLYSQIDYVIINTDNEVIGKDYSHKMYKAGLHDLSLDYNEYGPYVFFFYWKTVNSTITKNIQLGFNAAKTLGYTCAIYTEDDNIFKDGSFDYLYENLNALNNHKMAGWTGKLPTEAPMMCTAFFFAQIDWFVNNFTLPPMKKDWYDYETSVKYHLHRPYEYVFYQFFKDSLKLDTESTLFYNSLNSYNDLTSRNINNSLMDFGKSNRRFSESNLIDTFFTVLPYDDSIEYKRILILTNKTYYLPEGHKNYKVSIFVNDVYTKTIQLDNNMWYFDVLGNEVNTIKLSITDIDDTNDTHVKVIDCNSELIVNNGHVVRLTQAQRN